MSASDETKDMSASDKAKAGGIGHDAMRFIDRVVGAPLCRVLTWWDRLSGGARRVRVGETAAPRRLAFIALAEIGALVVSYPAVEAARRRFPDAEQYFITFPGGRDVLKLCGFPEDRIVLLDPSSFKKFVVSILQALAFLRRVGVDATVNFETYARFSTLFAYLTGARWRAGFHPFLEEGHSVGDLVTHKTIYSPHMHASYSYLAVVETLARPTSADPGPKTPLAATPLQRLRRPPSPEGMAAARDLLARACPAAAAPGARLVILNANASDLVAVRRWPAENYAALAHALMADPAVVVVLTGVPSEAAAAAALAQAIGGDRVADMAGATSFIGLLDLYDVCHLMVTNDSGPAHFASMTDLPTLALFGPETPKIFGPMGPEQKTAYLGLACSPCVSVYNQKRSACRDSRCMTGLTVDHVAALARRMLDEGRVGRTNGQGNAADA